MIYCKTGYTRYIPGIYQNILCVYHGKVTCYKINLPSALGSLRPGILLDLLSSGHREAAQARLGLSKVPQQGVDLVTMAAPSAR
jgi:hypothetical protein